MQHYYSNMYNCFNNTELAYPGPISSSGDSFTNHWRAYGVENSASTC